jgi:hypothetical protein
MTYYAASHPDRLESATIWTLEGGTAVRVDAPDAALRPRVFSGSPPNLSVKGFEDWNFSRLKLTPGTYYPRIARTTNAHLKDSPGFNPGTAEMISTIQMSNGQLVALKEQLERIFRVVHPDGRMMNAFGHDIRNVLILAATEVETHWKGVLVANGANAQNTHDYVKLAEAMQLGAYAVTFPHYPWIDPVRPFGGWKPSKSPTKDLPWYDAYNKVKHDRELNFPLATLGNAIGAVAASFVMMCAQFGMPGYWARGRAEVQSFFHLSGRPSWDLSDVYCKPHGASFAPVNYPF